MTQPMQMDHAAGSVETRMSRDSHVSQEGILIMSRLISYEIRYTWNQFLVEFLEKCMSRVILRSKELFRSSEVQRINSDSERIWKVARKVASCVNSFFLVRNTLQRVPKIHSLSLCKESKRDSSNRGTCSAQECGGVQRAGCWACWSLTKIGYCQH